MSRVLLVNPNTLTLPYPVPPLGLCLLAADLSARGHEVTLYDGTFGRGDGLAEAVARGRPEVIGLGLRNVDDMVLQAPRSFVEGVRRDFVEPLRRLSSAPLVLGGSGFSLFPEALLAELGAEAGVIGAGEGVFAALVARLAAGEPPDGLPGVITERGQGPCPSPDPAGPLHLPRAELHRWLDLAPYRRRGAYPIQTKRGCAQRCLYCTYPALEGSAHRLRPPAEVVDELAEALQHEPAMTYELVDSTLNHPPGHLRAICEEMVRRGLRPRLRAMGLNPRHVDADLLGLLRRAGFAQLDCTPDSAAPALLKALRKGFTAEHLVGAARAIRAAGMPTMWFFLLGGPGETAQTVAQTARFVAEEVSPEDMVHLAVGLRIYPGTALHGLALEQGLVQPGDPLLRPTFYVEPRLGRAALEGLVAGICAAQPNCVPAWESSPPPELLARALALRARQNLDEPMFRTLIRLRRESLT